MDSSDLFRTAAKTLEEGRHLALVTVIETTGSTPGKVGYKMLVFSEEAGIAGTVGGGFLEAKMIEEARRMLDRPMVGLFRFKVGETPEDEKGICGGSIEFLIETFDQGALPLFRELAVVAEREQNGVLVSMMMSGQPPRKIYLADAEQIGRVCTAHQQLIGAKGCGVPCTPYQFSEDAVEAVKEAAAAGSGGTRVAAGPLDIFVESLAQPPTVVLFGAGHVAAHIARFARSVHFRVVVCDDRPEYANWERFPEADEIVVEDFGRAFNKVRIDRHSYIVIVTRGHQHDRIVLEQAIRTEARYIGMIGSKRKTLTLLQKLRDQGIAQERIDRVYAPIGAAIGAVTAEEIALSIVCELVKVRRLGDAAGIGHLSLSRRGAGP